MWIWEEHWNWIDENAHGGTFSIYLTFVVVVVLWSAGENFFVLVESLISYENIGWNPFQANQHTYSLSFSLSHLHTNTILIVSAHSFHLLLIRFWFCSISSIVWRIIKKFVWTFERSAHFKYNGHGNGLKNEPKHHRKPFGKSLFFVEITVIVTRLESLLGHQNTWFIVTVGVWVDVSDDNRKRER